METKIVIEIENCSYCPFYKLDWAEYGYNIHCGAKKRLIKANVEYKSEMPEIPEWCPCRLEEE